VIHSPAPSSAEQWDVLPRARLEALAALYPAWRIWLDEHGWHARRRNGYLQDYRPGAPAFYVRADTATELAAQLCWQQAADTHAPYGCAAGARRQPRALPRTGSVTSTWPGPIWPHVGGNFHSRAMFSPGA